MYKKTYCYPKISVKLFRSLGGEIKPQKRQRNFIQGRLTWVTQYGQKIIGIYDFGVLEKEGYLCIRYPHPTEKDREIDYVTHLVLRPCNFNKRWSFVCPACSHPADTLYFVEGPYFACAYCQKLRFETKITDLPKTQRMAKFGSGMHKIRALEKLIHYQKVIRNSRPQF